MLPINRSEKIPMDYLIRHVFSISSKLAMRLFPKEGVNNNDIKLFIRKYLNISKTFYNILKLSFSDKIKLCFLSSLKGKKPSRNLFRVSYNSVAKKYLSNNKYNDNDINEIIKSMDCNNDGYINAEIIFDKNEFGSKPLINSKHALSSKGVDLLDNLEFFDSCN